MTITESELKDALDEGFTEIVALEAGHPFLEAATEIVNAAIDRRVSALVPVFAKIGITVTAD